MYIALLLFLEKVMNGVEIPKTVIKRFPMKAHTLVSDFDGPYTINKTYPEIVSQSA